MFGYYKITTHRAAMFRMRDGSLCWCSHQSFTLLQIVAGICAVFPSDAVASDEGSYS